METTLYRMNFRSGKMEPVDESKGDKNNLPVGTVIRLNGYSDPEYVITANMGLNEKFAYHGAIYETVNLEDGGKSRHEASGMMWMKDKKDNSIQIYITGRVMSPEAMGIALAGAALVKAENDRKAQEKAEAMAKELRELPARYPYLTPVSEATKYKSGVLGGKNIRIELKRAFPGIKFSVTNPHHGAININWTDGPIVGEVKKITGKYQTGNFNGMEDIYEYNHDNQFPEVFGGAQYVSENRHESPELIVKVAAQMGYVIASGECNNYGRLPGLDDETSQMIYREARKTRA